MPSMYVGRDNRTSFAQSWHINGDCPKGTIPVRRTSVKDLMRAISPQYYGRKDQYHQGREVIIL